MKTGSKNIVCNTWTDAARAASAEARKKGSEAKTGAEHRAAAKGHAAMANLAQQNGQAQLAIDHGSAMARHTKAANSGNAEDSRAARDASRDVDENHGAVPVKTYAAGGAMSAQGYAHHLQKKAEREGNKPLFPKR